MSRVPFVRLLLVPLVVLLLGAGPRASATETTALHLKGYSADAFFDVLSAHALLSTQIYVAVTEGHPATSAGPVRPTVLLTIFSALYADAEPVPNLDAVGRAVVDAQAFVVDPALQVARLTTPVHVYDRVSQASFDVVLDLSWRTTGGSTSVNERTRIDTIAFDVTRTLHGAVWPAQATGSLRTPRGADLLSQCFEDDCTPVPSKSASVMVLKNGRITITQNDDN